VERLGVTQFAGHVNVISRRLSKVSSVTKHNNSHIVEFR